MDGPPTSSLVLPAILATAACIAMVPVAWSRRSAPGARLYAVLMLAIAQWAAMQVPIVLAPDLAGKLFWSKCQYLGIGLTPPLVLAFALDFTGRRDWLTRRTALALGILPATTLLLAFTNESHGLLWSGVALSTAGPVPVLDIAYGPWFGLQSSVGYLEVLTAGLLLVLRMGQTPQQREQLVALFAALLMGVLFNVLHLLGIRPLAGLDPTPLGFALVSVPLGWCMLRYGLFDLVPVAREAVFDGIEEAVLALDEQGRIADLNAMARLMIDPPGDPVGRNALDVLPDPLPVLLGDLGSQGRSEVALRVGRGTRIYDATLAPLVHAGGSAAGRLLVLRDVTERKLAEEELLRTQADLRRANRELDRLARTDALTGLTNRRAWLERLGAEVERARRHEVGLGLVLIDLDHFKRVNDQHGHPAGDRVLQAVARALEHERRASDVAARIGGEEFAFLVTHATAAGTRALAERVRQHVESLTLEGEGERVIEVTLSAGTALLSGDEEGAEELLSRADAALYRAKDAGRNRVEWGA